MLVDRLMHSECGRVRAPSVRPVHMECQQRGKLCVAHLVQLVPGCTATVTVTPSCDKHNIGQQHDRYHGDSNGSNVTLHHEQRQSETAVHSATDYTLRQTLLLHRC